MEIRPPQKPNYPALAELLARVLGRPMEAEALANLVMADERYDPNLVLMAKEKGELLGFLHCAIEGRTAWLKMLAVEPKRRRQGLAREMLERMEERVFGEGATLMKAGFCPPPQFLPGVPESAAPFFKALGYKKKEGGSRGLLKPLSGASGVALDLKSAHILIGSVAPTWWGYVEEQLSFIEPRLVQSADAQALCLWEPGRVGPLFGEGSEEALRRTVGAAAGKAGENPEYFDSRPADWWRKVFQAQAEQMLEFEKDLTEVTHA